MIDNLNLKSPRLPSPPSTAFYRDGSRLIHVRRPAEETVQILSPEGKRRRLNRQYLPQVIHRGPDTPHPFLQSQLARDSRSLQRPIVQPSADIVHTGLQAKAVLATQARQAEHDSGLPLTRNHNESSRSVEAMVMSIPLLGKLRVLSSVAPPLKDTSSTNPEITARGAFVAIEGDSPGSAAICASYLENLLKSDEEFALKMIAGPSERFNTGANTSLKDYLDIISAWHSTSEEIKTYLTTASKDTASGPSIKSPLKSSRPVVLMPGYQLHASDYFASNIPITDAYAPTDHWQWMATLWRGIIGADVTVYIKDCSPEELIREKLVEIREDASCIIVRKDKDSRYIDESASRRLSFEVGEWIRFIGLKKD